MKTRRIPRDSTRFPFCRFERERAKGWASTRNLEQSRSSHPRPVEAAALDANARRERRPGSAAVSSGTTAPALRGGAYVRTVDAHLGSVDRATKSRLKTGTKCLEDAFNVACKWLKRKDYFSWHVPDAEKSERHFLGPTTSVLAPGGGPQSCARCRCSGRGCAAVRSWSSNELRHRAQTDEEREPWPE